MIPLRDTIRSYNFPLVNWLLIGCNILVFLFEISLPPSAYNQLIMTFGMVPARLHLSAPWLLLINPLPLITLVTHMFIHGGWFHIISNLWVLFIFGDNVEDRMGSGRYLLFYLISGIFAGMVQAVVQPGSEVPAIGASGAIAGVLGAYFLLYPRARVFTLILIVVLPWFVEVPAVIFLGFWFISQLFSGVSALSLSAAASAGGVAWWAHIGGFLFGMLVNRAFIPVRHAAFSRQYPDEYYPW
jgi:membrane associated rhomboid family serine protease